MEMSRAEFAEKKSIRDYLFSTLLPTGMHMSDLCFKEGNAYRFIRGYGPWDDDYYLLSSDTKPVEKYRLLAKLDKELSDGRSHERKLETEEMDIKISRLIKNYTADELLME
ncbi:hypothetical protein [Paenibacillus illinoisensis]|uniref:hypothetical protein n=1 Tax=Paenibacillus illinoisensis TaxID=59845 RepID=UPI003015987D